MSVPPDTGYSHLPDAIFFHQCFDGIDFPRDFAAQVFIPAFCNYDIILNPHPDVHVTFYNRTNPPNFLFRIAGILHLVEYIGPYAAGNILKLLGRYDYLGLDSWVRGRFYALHTSGRKVKDSTIERHYRPYGAWRGLFFWLEMTRDWHEDKFPPV